MRIFLTGGTGFIGSHFINQAMAAGHSIRALRRPGSKPRIELLAEPEWLEVPFDQITASHFEGLDVVVHLAAHSANVPYDTLENCLHWNVTIPLRMAQYAQQAGLKRYIVAGSCFEYGRSGERYQFIPTDAPLEPVQSYPISKAAASIAWMGFAREKNMSVSILRIFQVYGEGEPEGRLWPTLRANAIAGRDHSMTMGEQVRDFIPVEQVAARFVQELNGTTARLGWPDVIHVGTGTAQTVAEFSRKIWTSFGAKGSLLVGVLPYRDNEVMRFVPRVC